MTAIDDVNFGPSTNPLIHARNHEGERGENATPRRRVLLVDDEPKLRESLAEGLRLENWIVVTAATGSEAMKLISVEPIDLVVLDWLLPDIDGIELLRRIRIHSPHCPVLVFTARNSRSDQLVAVENGAADFVGKPFAFADLVARCRALLSPTKIPEDCLRQGEVELDPASHVVRSHGTEIPLSEIETSILKFMLSHPRDIATTDMLARQIWKEKALSVSLRPAIESQMQRLNQKIITGLGVPWIRSVQGIGYALEDSVLSTTRVAAQP